MTDPPTRHEWDEHLRQTRRIEGQVKTNAERVDLIEQRLDRYLGVAVATPWLLTLALTVLLVLERMDLLP